MKGVKFIVPAIILIGVVIFQSLFIVQEISQAIVLQFGDPKKIAVNPVKAGKSQKGSIKGRRKAAGWNNDCMQISWAYANISFMRLLRHRRGLSYALRGNMVSGAPVTRI